MKENIPGPGSYLQATSNLSKGIKTKNLTEYIPLSLAAIEKRKRHLKEVFDVEKKGDESLLDQARNTGFL
mgnify:CR=1 FL=1